MWKSKRYVDGLKLEKKESLIDSSFFKKSHKEYNKRIVSLGDELWQRRQAMVTTTSHGYGGELWSWRRAMATATSYDNNHRKNMV